MFDVTAEWYDYKVKQEQEAGPKPTATGTLLRCSDAGSCERQRAFNAIHAKPTERRSAQTMLAFEIGNAIHASLQEMMLGLDGFNTAVEVPVDLSGWDVSLSGHCDAVMTNSEGKCMVVEIKTMSGYGAVRHFTSGPKREHVAQAGLYAAGLDADAILIVYVAKEAAYRKSAGVRPGEVMQWYYELDEEVYPGESVRDVMQMELHRFARVEQCIKYGKLPEPLVQDEETLEMFRVDLPGPFETASKHHHWECRYCVYNTACVELGPDWADLSEVEVLQIG